MNRSVGQADYEDDGPAEDTPAGDLFGGVVTEAGWEGWMKAKDQASQNWSCAATISSNQ